MFRGRPGGRHPPARGGRLLRVLGSPAPQPLLPAAGVPPSPPSPSLWLLMAWQGYLVRARGRRAPVRVGGEEGSCAHRSWGSGASLPPPPFPLLSTRIRGGRPGAPLGGRVGAMAVMAAPRNSGGLRGGLRGRRVPAFVAAACRHPRCHHHCCGHFRPRHCCRRRDGGHLGVLCGRHPLPPLCGGRPLRFGSGPRTSGAALGPLADNPFSPQRPPPLPRSLLRSLIASLHPSVCGSAAPAGPASERGGPPFRHAGQRHGAAPIPSSAVCFVGGGGGVSVWAAQPQARPPAQLRGAG